jgi:GTPase SAR1 family protein
MFIRGKILIFEGPDGVGKTTLINHIKKKFKNSYYMHLRVHKNMKLWHTASARLAIRKQLEGKLVLIDRHWPSEYDNIDSVIDDYYFSWFGKCKRNVFIKNLSPLRERKDFIRYDMFKDGYKLDQFTDRIFNAIHV